MSRGARMVGRALEALPAGAVGKMVALHERSPLAQRLTAPVRRSAAAREATLRHGEAAGLRVHSTTIAASYSFGGHELDFQRTLAGSLSPGDTFFDIGAHIGLMSLIGARKVGSTGRVYAFEPEPGNATTVRLNAALNGFDNLHVVEKAAGSHSRKATLVIPAASPQFAMVADPDADVSGELHADVELVTVDELVADGTVAPPSVVKIDVQGAEAEVLRGMSQTLEEHRPLLLCELHGTGAVVKPLLDQLGYEVQLVDEIDPHGGDPEWGAHLLGRPKPA